MGTEESQVQPQLQWEWVSNEKGVQIYRNKDGRLAEKRRIVILGNYTLSEQNKVYTFRETNPYGLVKSYQAVPLQDKDKKKENLTNLCRCANEKIQMDVYTQRIAYRLSDLPQLTFPQSLSFLKQTAIAYEVAYKKLGGLHINPELIGVTEKGEIRAWVNENWALNHPSHYIPILKCSSKSQAFEGINPELRDQSQMICNLISVIEEKNENRVFPLPFGELLSKKSSNFRSLRRFLNQYISSNNIIVPDLINKNISSVQTPNVNNNLSVNNTSNQQPVQAKPVITSSQDSYDTQFARIHQSQRPVFVNNIPSIPMNTYNSPNFTFPNQSRNAPISIRQQSAFPINSYSPPYLSFNNPRPQLVNIQKQQINSLQSSYRPYYFQPNQESSGSNNYKPLFNGLKFSLLPTSQLGQQQRHRNVDTQTRPASPLLSLNQFMEKDEIKHTASYQIVDAPKNVYA